MSLKQELLEGKKKLGIWGLGYIGYSTLAYFSKHGVACIGTDISQDRIDKINKGRGTIIDMDLWLGFDVTPQLKSGLMYVTTDYSQLKDCPVHMIAVPTEDNGEPYHNILKDVISKICIMRKDMKSSPMIIIESTLTPTVINGVIIPLIESFKLKVGKDILLGVAPRRDWFTDSHQNLENLARVIGGNDKETTDIAYDVLNIVCKNLHKAPDCKHAAIVKSIENAYRQVEITLANQLALAYPDLNMTEILRLVGTKWNIGTYHPSLGTAGYCIPLAPKYVLEGAGDPDKLTIIKAAIQTDVDQVKKLAQKIIDKGYKRVGILGIAYMGDIKVHVLSRSIALIKELKGKVGLKVYDPYYTKEEIKKLTDCATFDFPIGLKEFDCIVLVPEHLQFRAINQDSIINNLNSCKEIIDNMGVWKSFNFPNNIKYHEVGDAGWLK